MIPGIIIASLALVISLATFIIAYVTFLTKQRPYVWVANGHGTLGGDSARTEFVVTNGGEVPAGSVVIEVTWHARGDQIYSPTEFDLGTIFPQQPVRVELNEKFKNRSPNGNPKELKPFERGAPEEEFTLSTRYFALGLPAGLQKWVPFKFTSIQRISVTLEQIKAIKGEST